MRGKVIREDGDFIGCWNEQRCEIPHFRPDALEFMAQPGRESQFSGDPPIVLQVGLEAVGGELSDDGGWRRQLCGVGIAEDEVGVPSAGIASVNA